MGPPKPATGHSPHTSDTAGSGDRRALQYPGRLLVVSPRGDERGMYAEFLVGAGYCVLETQSTAEASRLTRDLWLSAVITDVPISEGRDGLQLTVQLGRRSATPLPAMVVAGGNLEAVETGECDLVLLKPCPPDVLAELTARLVEARRQRTQPFERVE